MSHRRSVSFDSTTPIQTDRETEEIRRREEKKLKKELFAQIRDLTEENTRLQEELDKYKQSSTSVDAEETKSTETRDPPPRTVSKEYTSNLEERCKFLEKQLDDAREEVRNLKEGQTLIFGNFHPTPRETVPPPESDHTAELERLGMLLDEKNLEIEQLNQRIEQLSNELNDSKSLRQQLADQHDEEFKKMNDRHEAVQRDLSQSKSDLEYHRESNSTLEKQIRDLEKTLSKLRHQMDRSKQSCSDLTHQAEQLNLRVDDARLKNIRDVPQDDVRGRVRKSQQILKEFYQMVQDFYAVDQTQDMKEILDLYQFSLLILREKADFYGLENVRTLRELEREDEIVKEREEERRNRGACGDGSDNLFCFLFPQSQQDSRGRE